MNAEDKSYVNRIPEMKLNHWIVVSGHGLIGSGDDICFRTKADAIQEASSLFLDPRPTPKVKRMHAGSYEYFPKDVDTGEFRPSCDIIKLTPHNIEQYKQMWRDQVESDEYNL